MAKPPLSGAKISAGVGGSMHFTHETNWVDKTKTELSSINSGEAY